MLCDASAVQDEVDVYVEEAFHGHVRLALELLHGARAFAVVDADDVVARVLHGTHRVDGVVHAPGVARLRFHGGCGRVEYAALAFGCAHVVGGEHRREVLEQPRALQARLEVGARA